jgi:hypothetical protein
LLRFILLTAALGALLLYAATLGAQWGWFPLPGYRYAIVGFLFLVTAALGVFLLKRINPPAEGFVMAYLGTMVLRIFLFAGFAVIMVFLDRSGASVNGAYFLVCYFLFTAIEVGYLFRQTQLQGRTEHLQKDS